MEWLCGFFFFLAALTVIGHGLWLLAARILRAVTGNAPPPPPPVLTRREPAHPVPTLPCRNCGAPVRSLRKNCPECGLSVREAAEVADLKATLRTLTALRDEEVLDATTFDRLHERIEQRRERILAPPAEALPVAEVVAPASPAVPEPVPTPTPEPVPLQPVTPAPVAELVTALPAPGAPIPVPVVPSSRRPVVPSPPPPPRPPRRSLAEWLAAFMEQRNILWGELVGGLLVVGCSTALVLSLWRTLEEQIPLFPFLVFAGITATLFGVGRYTLHHWKLEATSRGLLVIATLLVPLNFLVLTGLAPKFDSLWVAALKLAAIPALGWLLHRASRDLVPADDPARDADARLLVLAVLGAAVSSLPVPLFVNALAPSLPGLLIAGAVPVACHGLALGLALRRRWREPLTGPNAVALFGLLGLATFALVLTLGFPIFWVGSQGGDAGWAVERLAFLTALAGSPILATGLFVQQRLDKAEAGSTTPEPTSVLPLLSTIGTGVALTGMLVLLAALVMAWPGPWALVAVGVLNFAVLTAVAFGFRLPAAHGFALPCLAVAFLVAYHLAAGLPPAEDADRSVVLLRQLTSGDSGTSLAVLVTLLTVATEGFRRFGRRADARFYAYGAGGAALLSLALVGVPAFAEPLRAALVCGWFAALGLLFGRRWESLRLEQAGAVLLVPALLAALHQYQPGALAFWGTAFAVEALVLSAVSGRWRPAVVLASALAAYCVALHVDSSLQSPWHGATAAALAATAFLQAARYRLPALSMVGSGLLFLGIAHVIFYDLASRPELPWAAALLGHATLALPAGLLLRRLPAPWRATFADPLEQTGLAASLVAVPVLALGVARPALTAAAVDWCWLAALWLTATITFRRPAWFTATQAALTAGVLFGVAANLDHQAAADGTTLTFTEPASLYAFGLGLAALSVLWAAMRLALRSQAAEVLEAPWPALDRVLLGGLVAVQLALAIAGVAPGVNAEMMPGPIAASAFQHVLEWEAWFVLGLTAVALATTLWDVRGVEPTTAVLLGLLAAAVLVPVLLAAPFAETRATASALRWGLSVVSVVLAVPFWARDRLARRWVRDDISPDARSVVVLRTALIAATVIPCLLLTIAGGTRILAGEPLGGPLADSLFAKLGHSPSYALPLAVVVLGLVGHALRERSAAFAFAGGCIANFAVAGGFALGVVDRGLPWDETATVQLLQWATVTAAAWALGWRLVTRRQEPSPLWELQWNLGAAGALVLLASAVLAIAGPVPPGNSFPPAMPWAAAVGGILGWTALALAVAGGLVADRARRGADALAVAGLGAVVLLACDLAGVGPAWAFRTLTFGWAGCALAGAAWAGRSERSGLDRWVGLAAGLAVALALKAAVFHGDHRPSAAAIALASLAGGWLALRRRRDDVAVVSALGVNLAMSLVVWDAHVGQDFGDWLVPLLQANAGVSAILALFGMATRTPRVRAALARFTGPSDRLMAAETRDKLLTEAEDARTAGRRFLDVQILLAGAFTAILFALPWPNLLMEPGHVHDRWVFQVGSSGGWVALVTMLVAMALHARWSAPALRGWVGGVGGLTAGVWLACTVARWDNGTWLSFHVVMATWLVAGLASLVWKPLPRVRWVPAFAALAVALALRGIWDDPARPYAPGLAVLAAAGLVAGLAWREQRRAAVEPSGLLAALAGLVPWFSWGSGDWVGCADVVILGLAAAAVVWRTTDRALSVKFRHQTALIATVAMAVVAGIGLLSRGVGEPIAVAQPLTWWALGMTALAVASCWGEPEVWFAPSALYAVGLTGIALGLLQADLQPEALAREAAPALAGYVLLVQMAASFHARPVPWAGLEPWFIPTQTIVSCVALLLSVGVALEWGTSAERLAGPLAVALLWPAGALMARESSGRWVTVTLTLPALLLAELGWAALALPADAPVLHRTAVLAAALALTALADSFALPRLLPGSSPWREPARQLGPVLGLISTLILVPLVVLEALAFDPATKCTPLGPAEVAVLVASVLGLTAAAFALAVRPGADPFGLTERGRTAYVYAGELLLVFLFLHLRFNVPWLFQWFSGRYWAFVVMAIAFAGTGLGEFFRRRQLAVLAGPLGNTGVLLPLLPLLAFWLRPPAALREAVGSRLPGTQPLFASLDAMPHPLDSYAILWFLFGLLYAGLAVTRQSFRYSLFAALAVNAGLWALLQHNHVAFLVHPQLWLIPLALIVLASEQHHRDRLRPEVAGGLRYLGLGMLYLSSTADLFIEGLGHSVVLPLALMVLSVGGVLLGILLRVRAYLYLGAGFLGLVIFSMIWHAAVDRSQTWLWFASGILLGAAILALFALFEKRRPQVQRALEEFRMWQ